MDNHNNQILQLSNTKHNKSKYSQQARTSSKRYSLTKSRKINLDNFLNKSFTYDDFNCNYISTSTGINPEQYSPLPQKNSPQRKLPIFISKKVQKGLVKVQNTLGKPQQKYNIQSQSKKKKDKKIINKMNSSKTVQDILKQDVKLRVVETVQFDQWMELLREYKFSAPHFKNEADAVLKQFQKLIELKENLEMCKYKLMSRIL